jgi:trigger factor
MPDDTPADAGTTTPETSVQILEEGPCRKRMKVEVPAARVEEELETNYKQLRETIQLPGFRKGRVPISILRGRFGKKIEAEVQEEMISRTFFDEVEKRELKVLGAPSFENIAFAPGDPLVYEAAIEVSPEFELPAYKGLEIDEQPVGVTAEDVDREVRSLLEQHTTLEPVPAGEKKTDDIAVCHLEILDGAGKEVFSRPEVFLKIGHDHVDQIALPGLGEKLIAAKEDEHLEFAVDVPGDFPIEEVRGGKVTLRLHFHEAKRPVVPALDEEMLARLEFGSVEELRAGIERNLEMRRRLQEENRQEEELVERIVEGVRMEFPPSVLERRKEEISMGRRFRQLREGRSQEEIEKSVAGDAEAIETEAREELRRIFILDRIAEEEKVLVTEDEIARRISAIALTSRRDPQEVFQEYRENGLIGDLRAGMRREKARAVLRKKAKLRKIAPPAAPESGATD